MEREREGEKLRLFSLPNTTVREFNWRERERDLEKIREAYAFKTRVFDSKNVDTFK